MPVIPCKMQTKHDRIRLINIDFQNLHKISEILVYRNPVHQFAHYIRPISYSIQPHQNFTGFYKKCGGSG